MFPLRMDERWRGRRRPVAGKSSIPIILTVIHQTALLAKRIARTADAAAVTDQIDMRFEVALGWNHFAHQAVGLFIRALFRNQSEPVSYSEDVSVNGKHRAVASEKQCASDGLWADAFEARQELLSLFERCGVQKPKIERASSSVNFVEELFDSSRLLPCEPARSDCRFD